MGSQFIPHQPGPSSTWTELIQSSQQPVKRVPAVTIPRWHMLQWGQHRQGSPNLRLPTAAPPWPPSHPQALSLAPERLHVFHPNKPLCLACATYVQAGSLLDPLPPWAQGGRLQTSWEFPSAETLTPSLTTCSKMW